MRVVVTGGAGFIGTHVVAALVCEGADQIVIVDDLSSGDARNVRDAPSIDLIRSSILDVEAVAKAVAGADSVVHLAAQVSVPRSVTDPAHTHAVNVAGTHTVLEAVRTAGVPHFVLASSAAVYGDNASLPAAEDAAVDPRSPYAASKAMGEAEALAYAHAYGLEALCLRFFNAFGPGQSPDHAYAAAVPAFASRAAAGEPLVVHGDGEQTRDFLDASSVGAVVATAVRDRVHANQPVNVGRGERISILELIARLESIVGEPLAVEHTEPRAGDVRDSQADVSRLRSLFPDLEPTPLDEALAATIDWFRAGQPRPWV